MPPLFEKGLIIQPYISGKMETVIVFCAHSDDQIFGPGGTVAKYAAEGKEVINIIFSPGELTHPWLKRRITIEMRENEAKEADKIIGGKEVLFLGIKESTFVAETKHEWVKAKIDQLIHHYKPSKIFTHSIDDLHPAHRAVHNAIIDSLDRTKYKCDAYSFEVWNPFNIRSRKLPRMYVDITDTFGKKLKALNCFKSQWMTMIFLLWTVYLRAILTGFEFKRKYAERFYKIR